MKELQANYAYEIDNELKTLKRSINYNFLTMGYYLYEVKTKKLYELLDYESFNAYISQPELSIKRSTAYKMLGIYETFVLELKVPERKLLEIDYGKLDMIRSNINPDNREAMLEKAEHLSRSDLRAEIDGKEIYQVRKFCPHCLQEVDQLITEIIDK